jgi:hypothetical protein
LELLELVVVTVMSWSGNLAWGCGVDESLIAGLDARGYEAVTWRYYKTDCIRVIHADAVKAQG